MDCTHLNRFGYAHRHRGLIEWLNANGILARHLIHPTWHHCFPFKEVMEKARQQLASQQKITPTKAHGTIAVRWDLDYFFSYISTQVGVLNKTIFPEPIYVLIFRGYGFLCGSRLWVQTTITFANHMAKACTPGYKWPLDPALLQRE